MRTRVSTLALLAAVALSSVAGAKGPESFSALSRARAATARPTLARELARARAVVGSMDLERALPSFVWAVGPHPASMKGSIAQAARSHVVDFAGVYALSPSALDAAHVAHVHDTGRGGIVVTLRQTIGDAELRGSDMKLLMRRDLELVALSGSLDGRVGASDKPAAAFAMAAERAAAIALGDLFSTVVADDAFVETAPSEGGDRRFELGPTAGALGAAVHLVRPARVKRVWLSLPERLVPAYVVELYAARSGATSGEGYEYVVSAEDGRLLERRDLQLHDSFAYRVWAESSYPYTPLDGPHEDYTPHPTGVPDDSVPAFISPTLVSVEGLNHNPNALADPWLAPGALETLGNNVDAHTDSVSPDGFSDGDARAPVTSAASFDRIYDTSLDPQVSADQSLAAVTELFYLTNWLHDYWYDSGFNEGAGNAQSDNFGRGGLGGDPLVAQAQDFLGTNNARIFTFEEGSSPVMEMFLCSAVTNRVLEATPGGPASAIGLANFGPTAFDITASLVLVDDGSAEPTLGCQSFVNDVAGQIVLIDRGTCTFKQKAVNAEAAGALGIVVANHTAGAGAVTMGEGDPPGDVAIGLFSTSYEDGVALKSSLAGGPVTVHMLLETVGPRRDTAIDNLIVAHEWGHHLHMRLTNGSSRQYGAESEGWGDFLALHMALREGDDLDGAFPNTVYAFAFKGVPTYFGLRRLPYSVDPTKNAYTFRHISDGEPLPAVPANPNGVANSEVHNAGEIWGAMLLEASMALLERSQETTPPYDFTEAKRRVADYVVAGLQLTPTDATFTEARDALIAAAKAADPTDAQLIIEAFARRGAGSCAQSPARFSTDLTGVVESFSVDAKADITLLAVEEGASCDHDGYIDASELGVVTLEVRNGGQAPLEGASVTLSTATEGLTIDDATRPISSLDPLESTTLSFSIALADAIDTVAALELTATVNAPGACESTVVGTLTAMLNIDEQSAASATETAESAQAVWAKTGDLASVIWRRIALSGTEHALHGDDYGSRTDTALVSPLLAVSPTEPLVISFDHAFSFEADVPGAIFYDGGVVELSEDNGQSWVDVSSFADPGYLGPISDCCGNLLAGRAAYVGTNPSYPAMDTVTLDLGTAFADKNVRLRFRISTDSAVAAPGWDLDNIAVSGILNTPFSVIGPDTVPCVLPGCGNGIVDFGEQCDAGEGNSDTEPNGCRTDCFRAHCGDGVLDTGEECDDGDDNSSSEPNACRQGCLAAHCGDGVLDDGEACDEGMFNSAAPNACRLSCTEPRCGDGTRDDGEQCDDGNDVEADLCTSECTWGPGSTGGGNASGGAPAAPTPKPEADDASCSCRLERSGAGSSRGGLALLAGALVAAAARRRRRR